MSFKGHIQKLPWCIFSNVLLLYICYFICRLVFICINADVSEPADIRAIWCRGPVFDSYAIFLTNTPYFLAALMPVSERFRSLQGRVAKVIFLVVNITAIAANLADSVYFPFCLKRTTGTVFSEFSGNTNLFGIFADEIVNHWYLTLLLIALAVSLALLYVPVGIEATNSIGRRVGTLVALSLCCVASCLCDKRLNTCHPSDIPYILNTPYSMISGRDGTELDDRKPALFSSLEEAEAVFSPLHMPAADTVSRRRNVVIIIVESLSESLTGYRDSVERRGGTLTPFVDSLARRSLTFEHTFANGYISIDALPSVLSSLPRLSQSFFTGAYSTIRVPSLPRCLGEMGYETAFFHGAENTSMGFHKFTDSLGIERYYGYDEYVADPHFGGKADYDGRWAIYDEEFLQFVCRKTTEMHEPFLSVTFTASSHHPYRIPERYADSFSDGAFPIYKSIRYADMSLRHFFETAAMQPWYENTIFVIVADHTCSRGAPKARKGNLQRMRIPILFFDPSGEMGVGVRNGVAQQIDIMPTLLGYLGYDKPYIAYGTDLLNSDPSERWAFNWLNIPVSLCSEYSLRSGNRGHPRVTSYIEGGIRPDGEETERRLTEMEAFIYSCLDRMQNNNMIYDPSK